MSKLFILIGIIFSVESYAQNKKMCLTVDDLPTVPYRAPGHEIKLDITNGLSRVFKEFTFPPPFGSWQ